jgi:hypothetical protein
MHALMHVHIFQEPPDVLASVGEVLILVEVDFFLLEGAIGLPFCG